VSTIPKFIHDILAERTDTAPDRVRFIANTAEYLFREDASGHSETGIRKGLASARDCCCDLRDRVLAALDGPAPTDGVRNGRRRVRYAS
jgi:hypothetical protein